MSNLLKNIIRFTLFILVQAFVLDKVPPLHQFVKPILYFLFVLWLPFSINRSVQLIIAFIFGLCMDYFTGTPGMHAIPCVMIAYLRPFLLNILLSQEKTEVSYAEPSIKSLGWAPYSVYIVVLTFIHHACLVLIEWLQFGDFVFFIGKVAASTAVSILLIFITEMLFPRKAKFRTNAA
ncbi:rod shape-determining protein MreD [Panacibacter ginsenosidivorans]|uniref:Rod shape-determining protein MreD n=1 Tax=Panacibacter ginsenosidivorans TaxID=1813871 RepID=A0A5B8V7M4_9BACT|nr:rod shape-determining protein MreD [Panacibacter ginsenosidivorans]QEC67530.1 rod shape-determining protein MreD [Panacibacter ginsenosidivorans]